MYMLLTFTSSDLRQLYGLPEGISETALQPSKQTTDFDPFSTATESKRSITPTVTQGDRNNYNDEIKATEINKIMKNIPSGSVMKNKLALVMFALIAQELIQDSH